MNPILSNAAFLVQPLCEGAELEEERDDEGGGADEQGQGEDCDPGAPRHRAAAAAAPVVADIEEEEGTDYELGESGIGCCGEVGEI